MEATAFARDCAGLVPADRIARGVPLAPLTTFKVGGPADWLIDVRDEAEIGAVIAAAARHGLPVTVLGGGSNVLVADAGVRGVVLRLGLRELCQPSPERVRADAGVTINGLVRWTIGKGLAGLEAWAGTPGTVGGAIAGNAHFQGRHIGDLTAAVRVISPAGRTDVVTGQAMAFAYDRSRIQQTREVVVWAEFVVTRGDTDALRARARESLAFRKRTQPLSLASAGCIFQNPGPGARLPAGLPSSAGALVDQAGLKGLAIGAARISTTHANFVVTDGSATAADIRRLIEHARAAVLDRFGVQLEYEVVIIGDWSGTR